MTRAHHRCDCLTSIGPAYPVGECDCDMLEAGYTRHADGSYTIPANFSNEQTVNVHLAFLAKGSPLTEAELGQVLKRDE